MAYAPPGSRAGLHALFALDERLGQVVTSTTEPMIGLMRLAWWREAIERLGSGAPPAEPLLEALSRLVIGAGAAPASVAEIEDGWAALLDETDPEALAARHAQARGRTLFAVAARILGADDARLSIAGEVWALADLSLRHSDERVRAAARRRGATAAGTIDANRWPKAARPLAALLVLARRDLANGARHQGSPARLLRALALRLFGR